ncbi:dTDP-4-dehydrorhamnose 3,5-epimerase family protein [Streptomyces sp. NPDC006193]|uniref:dTDP-4-dehydrorhamnose 3,5-epimerase family protein n=1 Tax=Streptomyces sp. NPDC006193 TaxID=3155717 RepID=UPI0033AD84F9
MKVQERSLPGVFLVSAERHEDERGHFYESFRRDVLAEAVGHPVIIEQTNCSVTRRGGIRGIHSTNVPPGQAKIVTCVRGSVLDMVVDLRVGSPTFGKYEVTWLDAQASNSLYISEGLGHAFLALVENSCVFYQCSASYMPEQEFIITPFDRRIGLPWGLAEEPIVAEKYRAAPTLEEALERGILPTYEQCLAFREDLRRTRNAR